MCLVVQIPTDGNKQHLQAEVGEGGAGQQKAEIPGTKGGVGVQINRIAYGLTRRAFSLEQTVNIDLAPRTCINMPVGDRRDGEPHRRTHSVPRSILSR